MKGFESLAEKSGRLLWATGSYQIIFRRCIITHLFYKKKNYLNSEMDGWERQEVTVKAVRKGSSKRYKENVY